MAPIEADGLPDEKGVFKGLAQAPLHFQNLVAELVDNALAAAVDHPEVDIDISAHRSGGDLYVVRVVDNGPGISLAKLKADVFALGRKSSGGSHLNEHGYGLKNVLAKTEQLTGAPWSICTRDADAVSKGIYFRCERPLKFKIPISELTAASWPTYASSGTGTLVEFAVPMTYLQTVALGRRGALPRDPGRIMDYLREHLGVFYRGYLEGGLRATAMIRTSLESGVKDPVEPVIPDYRSKDTHTIGPITIGTERVTIDGELVVVDKDAPQTRRRLLYYRHSPESQGIDIRLGHRVIATRLLSEIWGVDRHPKYNGIAGEFRVPAVAGLTLPTLNNKTSLDFDSPLWHSVADAIVAKIPADELPHTGGKSEEDLREELFSHMSGLKRPGQFLEEDFDCGNGVYVDIVWDQTSTGGAFEIYEVKKGKAAPLDVYQLIMYWDALVESGKQPTRGYLVADGATSSVSAFLRIYSTRVDGKGRPYVLERKDWSDHGIRTT